jgi:uncharacterized protein YbjT (DUF2867 family)
MKAHHALILGATGLIGSELLKQLLADASFEKITLLVRRHVAVASPIVDQHVIDFSQPDTWLHFGQDVDVVFCAVGTTRSKTPNLVDYRKIDFDIPVNAIRLAEKNKIQKFMLVSSVGASANSKNFYLRIKGEVEDVLKHSSIAVKGIFQPSLLLGERKERRVGEYLARAIMPVFNFMIPMKYKPIQAAVVASAMIEASKKQDSGLKTYFFDDMLKLARP